MQSIIYSLFLLLAITNISKAQTKNHLFFLPIPVIFGHEYLFEIYGEDYETYRLLVVIASGIGVLILITNLFISLVSMYLGHKLTFVSLSIALLGLYFGFKY